MYFEYLIDVEMPNNKKGFSAAKELYEVCCEIEKNARISPDRTMIMIRQAEEILVKGMLIDGGYAKYFEDYEKKAQKAQGSKEPTLYSMINKCKEENLIEEENTSNLHKLRMDVNNIVHISLNSQGKRKYAIENKHATIKDSCENTIKLYDILADIFKIKTQRISADDLPIGEYQIVRKIKAKKYEAVTGEYKYIGKISSSNIDTYAYIRPFSKKEDTARKVFDERDLEVQNFFKNMRGSRYIIRANEIHTSSECEVRYLAYDIRKNTKTLDQIVNDLKPKDVLEIISQVACGLSELAASKINIHHRGIRPTCIFVNKFDDGYEAKLGCFETAKIEYTEKNIETVHEWMVKAQQENIFIHPKLLEMQEVTSGQWEAGDVYSLTKVLIFCVDKDYDGNGEPDFYLLEEYFSDEFLEQIEEILVSGDTFDFIPSMSKFEQILTGEIKNG